MNKPLKDAFPDLSTSQHRHIVRKLRKFLLESNDKIETIKYTRAVLPSICPLLDGETISLKLAYEIVTALKWPTPREFEKAKSRRKSPAQQESKEEIVEVPSMKNLWILKSISPKLQSDHMIACVVRASNSVQARRTAGKFARGEGSIAWLSSEFSTCRMISLEGDEEIILSERSDG